MITPQLLQESFLIHALYVTLNVSRLRTGLNIRTQIFTLRAVDVLGNNILTGMLMLSLFQDLSPNQNTAAQSGTPSRTHTPDPPARSVTMTPQAVVNDLVPAPEALGSTTVREVPAGPPIGSLESVLTDGDPVVHHLSGQGLPFTVGALLYNVQAPGGAAPPISRGLAVVNDWP